VSRELVSTLTAAKRYGISEKSIRRYIAQGLITGYRVGQRRLIRVDLVEADARLLTPIPTVKGLFGSEHGLLLSAEPAC
jgi:excisionase family DNA binding protein